jgi:FkbM family methyltransferase
MRTLIWRVARRAYCYARRDEPNVPDRNGEYWLIDQVVSRAAGEVTMVDVGAFRGEWSDHAAAAAARHSLNATIHAFEPSSFSVERLRSRFDGQRNIRIDRVALSDHRGETDFFVVGGEAATNSLYQTENARREAVPTASFDELMAERGVDRVLLVKTDTEGHDFTVMRGASKALGAGRVDVWQFEYNHRWVSGRAYLRDVFDFIADKPYRIGKLYRSGIETFDSWHYELERFFETNFVLVRKESAFERLCSSMRFNERNVLVPA